MVHGEPMSGRKRGFTTRLPKYEEISKILNNRIDIDQIQRAEKEEKEFDFVQYYQTIRVYIIKFSFN